MTNIKIETANDGVTLSQDSPSPEWSITGKGGRTYMVFIAKDEAPAVITALQRAIGEEEA
ncbi:hypothetical protein [Rhizobium laguerreae]|uniref:hypothetical protein n=1 Tax=Rhizobium laguerreae TaxID=1076926 RepID=UPI001C90C691|nr:hypothetical protein [Rhizobium laguerreae]MBY3434866.1 hypothetical protein [Rhizobium laguerreae]MBY3449008.1 hypothetical protein [Rhizobium laguerreae]MBY3456782.1 hypothetical protein [Rhizobium laguerreae]